MDESDKLASSTCNPEQLNQGITTCLEPIEPDNPMLEAIDIYCERLGPEFWAEPWNAISNLAFIFACLMGVLLIRKLVHKGQPVVWLSILSLNAFAIGVGSFLFHTFANRWSMLADVIPISVFMCLYLVFALTRVLQVSRLMTVVYVLLFLSSGAILPRLVGDAFNGSAGYFPAWITLAIIGHFVKSKNWQIAKLYLAAMATFALSLIFRTIDPSVCSQFTLGTHFLWHTLNGFLLAILIYASYLSESQWRANSA